MGTSYRLYLESGPKHRKTMVHVPELLGCVAVGPTTAEAVAAAPDAIRAFLRLMQRHGARVDPDAPFDVVVAQHITEGYWLGNGDPDILFEPDLAPLSQAEVAELVERFYWMRGEVVAWACGRPNAELNAPPPTKGRTAMAILLHIAGASGYLSGPLGGTRGLSALHGQAERAEIQVTDALARQADLLAGYLGAATEAQRTLPVQRPNGRIHTLRRGVRRMLEHEWEHLAELSRRPGGPEL